MRQWQEVQEMPRSLILAILFISSACASIWPEQLGQYHLKSATGSALFGDLRPEWDEYGEDAIEQADYGSFKATALRFKDTTGAYAASLEPGGRVTSRIGNYLVMCAGVCPKNFLKLAEAELPNVSQAPLPSLGEYLPQKGRIVGSERYIVGPQRLDVNFPQIPKSAVGFQFGTEGAMASYRILRNEPKNEATVAIFSYPTPQIARQQAPAFEAISGAAVKRTGPLVVLVLGAPDRAAADQLLNQINYQASVTMNEPLPLVLTPQSTAQMLLSIITLAGIVLGFCLASGLLFGGLRVIARKFGYTDAGTAMTTLHLSDK
jgi:hypothetical protein